MLANAIAEYTGVGREGLKKLSSDGAISAAVIKNALFMAAQDIETKYAELPKTFSDYWTEIKNSAVMNASFLMNDINSGINTEGFQRIVDSVKNGISNALEWARYKFFEFKNIFSDLNSVIPSLSEIAHGFFNVGSYIISARGTLGKFTKSLTSIIGSKGFKTSMNIVANSFLVVSKGIGFAAQMIAHLNERFSGLLPVIMTVVVGYRMFQGLNNTLQSVVVGVANSINQMVSGVSSFSRETRMATLAQRGLNSALNANPYVFVASAIMTVVSAIGALIGSIVTLNKTAGLASDMSEIKSAYDPVIKRIAEVNGVSISTASQIYSSQKESEKQIEIEKNKKKNLEDLLGITKTKEKVANYEQAIFAGHYRYNENGERFVDVANAGLGVTEKTLTNWQSIVKSSSVVTSQYDKNIVDIRKQFANEKAELIEQDKEMQKMKEEMEKMKGEFDSCKGEIVPYSGLDVDKVKEVDKVNDTVDIASEDLKYWREIAEQDAINKFTTNTLVPQLQVTFSGDIKETADIEKMADIIAEKMQTSILMSAQGLHN